MNKSEIAERLKLTADTLPSYDECSEDIGPDDGKVFLRRFIYDNTPGEPDSENIFRHNLAEVLNEQFERVERAIAEEVSPSANFVSEIRPRPDDPSCHVCGARMVVKEWKCLSCKATTGVEEVSPLSEYEQQAAGFANYALEVKGLLTEEFGEHFPEDIPAVVEILAQTEDFLKRGKFGAEGDTRELKAALRKALLIHWLSQIECNHEEKNDSAICACGWKSERGFNVGKAVELWIDHVFAELG